MSSFALAVKHLSVDIATPSGVIRPVDDVSFSVRAGRTLALVGESGSGKSITCLSLLRVLPPSASVVAGEVVFEGVNLLGLPAEAMSRLRGSKIGTVLQDPHASLDPLFTVGDQVREIIDYQQAPGRAVSRQRSVDALRRVHIPAPEQRYASYPHQFSGGMRQRAAIAMAVACNPSLLIADEPTTALDVTIRLQVMRLLAELQAEHRMAMLFVTHDLHVVRSFCDDVAVMYAGRIVEQGPVEQVFAAPAHPYTAALIDAIPTLAKRRTRLTAIDGQPPSFTALPSGCHFAPRCPAAQPQCVAQYPSWQARPTAEGSGAACWRATEMLDGRLNIQ
ncbi:ABC transporter ATP-binding protein [Pseudomonas typographi]|uniref:ABC transporter ATP-binding protein n=1 Tax=Pseudomonas typographi TaxID=2715964 RepID=UPI0016842016|nr:ABC transporter ATP-binding protein [Pseudomonas typographi]MBD1587532.1 ABC transporter ATP-binding protein [Pseudomonas typographi]